MENDWLRMNKKKLDELQHTLAGLAYRNENPSVPIGLVRGFLGAMEVEINKLQTAKSQLEAELNTLKEGLNKQ